MISFAEFEIAVRGLLHLVRFDAAFAGFFDLSREGARRSFRLAFPLLPISLLAFNLNIKWPDGSDMVRIGAAELIGYTLGWTLLPLLLLWCGQAFRLGPRVFGAVAVYNWLSVLSVAIQLPISVAVRLGFDQTIGGLLSEGGVIFITACEFFAFKRLLGVAFEAALALAITDFFIGWLLIRELIVPLALGQF
ncbi:MAG TPA: hypothetical protein VHA35_09180 [Dongiaceae bacterium]|jgi:hypothetical protein|nr:hypothetical protein [Dongiaceae bacterium]